jgi:hypothetical protein
VKTVQKLELYFSIAVLLAALSQLLLFIFYMPKSEDSSLTLTLAYGGIFLIIPSVLIFLGSYIHNIKENILGLAVLIFFGGIFVCLYVGIVLAGILIGSEINRDAVIGMIIWLFPSFFVGCTMIFASINAFTRHRQQV